MSLMGIPLNPLEDRDRHIITSDTEVLGGVLLTRAGIVVDVEENPGVYQAVLKGIDDRLAWQAEVTTPTVLKAVDREVNKRILYYPSDYAMTLKEEAESRGFTRMTPDQEMGLSRFVSLGVGICHQHALLTATMLRLLQERGDIGGSVSLESTLPDEVHPDRHTRVAFAEDGENFTLSVNGGVLSDSRIFAFV